jgi:hypothetical protein
MEIDLTSIIIGIAALSTFFVPIGMHQFSQKRKLNKTKKVFEAAAEKNGLQIHEMEVLRNGVAIGIDINQENVLYIENGNKTLIGLRKIAGCKLYKHQRKDTLADGSKAVIHEQGIQLNFHTRSNDDVVLLFFQGKEGSTYGDEGIIIERWIVKMTSALKKSSAEVAV